MQEPQDENSASASGESTAPVRGRDYFMALGIDPGFAMTGTGAMALLADGSVVSAGVSMIKTEKNKDKRFERQRVSMDDERRLREFYNAFCGLIEKVRPHVIGVEVYSVFDSKNHDQLRDVSLAFLSFLGLARSSRPPFSTANEFLQALAGPGMFEKFLQHLGAMSGATDAFRQARGRGDAAKTNMVYAMAQAAAFRYDLPIYGFMPVDLKKAVCGKPKATKEEVIAGLDVLVPTLRAKVLEKKIAAGQHNHVYDASGHALMALREWVAWRGEGIRGTQAWTPGETP